jgi:hypothetical protein
MELTHETMIPGSDSDFFGYSVPLMSPAQRDRVLAHLEAGEPFYRGEWEWAESLSATTHMYRRYPFTVYVEVRGAEITIDIKFQLTEDGTPTGRRLRIPGAREYMRAFSFSIDEDFAGVTELLDAVFGIPGDDQGLAYLEEYREKLAAWMRSQEAS